MQTKIWLYLGLRGCFGNSAWCPTTPLPRRGVGAFLGVWVLMGLRQGCIRVGGWVAGSPCPCPVLHISSPILLHASLKENNACMVMCVCCKYKSQLTIGPTGSTTRKFCSCLVYSCVLLWWLTAWVGGWVAVQPRPPPPVGWDNSGPLGLPKIWLGDSHNSPTPPRDAHPWPRPSAPAMPWHRAHPDCMSPVFTQAPNGAKTAAPSETVLNLPNQLAVLV